jgi:hypothetical protein
VRVAFLAWSVVGVGGCASISGLDQIGESPCAPDCDAAVSDDGTIGGEGRADTSSTVDSWQAGDTSGDQGSDGAPGDTTPDSPWQADAPAGEASATDASDGSSGSDAPGDGSADARNAGDAMGNDAATEAESGCGATNTVGNCGSCGTKCAPAPSTSIASANCNSGTSCAYQCQSGYLDCNASVAPNVDGCECATPGSISATCCPSNACPTQHATGFLRGLGSTPLDQTFYDCNTSINAQVAMEACTQYSGNASNCATNTTFMMSCGAGDSDLVVCNFYAMSQDCVCWDYQGTALGWAVNSHSTLQCTCPSGNSALGEVQYH